MESEDQYSGDPNSQKYFKIITEGTEPPCCCLYSII